MAFFGLFVVDRDVSRNKEKKTHISERYRHEKSLKKKTKREHSHNWFHSFLKKTIFFLSMHYRFQKMYFQSLALSFNGFMKKKRECFFKNHFIPLLCNVNIHLCSFMIPASLFYEVNDPLLQVCYKP